MLGSRQKALQRRLGAILSPLMRRLARMFRNRQAAGRGFLSLGKVNRPLRQNLNRRMASRTIFNSRPVQTTRRSSKSRVRNP